MPTEITIDDMLNYLNARIKTTEDHLKWYKRFGSEKSYIAKELALQKAIREILNGTTSNEQ